MEDNAKKPYKLYIWLGILVLIIVIGVIGYSRGYRINNFTVGRVGYLNMEIPLINTSIFIDNQKTVTTKDDQSVRTKLSPGTHRVIVSRLGYFPWTKQFFIPSDREKTLSPIFITTNTTGEIITNKDPEYWSLRNKIVSDVSPTKDSPRISSDKSTTIWLEDNAIIAKVGSSTTRVIQPDSVIKNVDFYRDRSDAVVFSMYNSIYMIETSKDGTQNFMPIYKGNDPSFIPANQGSIYVLDGDNLMQVVI